MKRTLTPALARVFERLHYPFDVMLMCVLWYVADGLSVRNQEEMMAERGIEVDHSRQLLEDRKRLVMHVPSVVCPNDDNLILNPAHPGMKHVVMLHKQRFELDRRLFK